MYEDKTNARHDAVSKDVNKGREREKNRERARLRMDAPPQILHSEQVTRYYRSNPE